MARIAGSMNKRSIMLRRTLERLDWDIPRELKLLLPKLEPGDRAQVLLALMPYVFPKIKEVEHDIDESNEILVGKYTSLSDDELRKRIEEDLKPSG